MRHRTPVFAVLAGAVAASAALAQTATPRVRTTVVVSSEPAKVTLSTRGTDAKPYLAVQATAAADVRTTLKDMGTKANINVVLDPSAVGTFSGSVEAQPAETAVAAVAKLAGLSVKKIVVPDASVATFTPDLGGQYVTALSTLNPGVQISDPATGKTLMVSAAEPAQASGKTVYFVHGRISPFGGRMRMGGQPGGPGGPGGQPGGPGGQPGGQPPQPSQANQAFVDSTAKSLQAMPLQQRFDTLRALSQSIRDSMTPEEQAQMRATMGGRGGFGGFGGGRRGGGNGGGGNGAGGNGGQGGANGQ
ncbi:MAG TPA: hypothetical protein VGM51_17810 [Armatimonadota bacterium]|jgi:hypothetical protein